MDQNVQVGTSIIITKDDKLLLMKRKGSHGGDTWSTPGGHNDIFEETGKHYITIWLEGKPVAAEQEVEEIGWFAWNALYRPHYSCLWKTSSAKTAIRRSK